MGSSHHNSHAFFPLIGLPLPWDVTRRTLRSRDQKNPPGNASVAVRPNPCCSLESPPLSSRAGGRQGMEYIVWFSLRLDNNTLLAICQPLFLSFFKFFYFLIGRKFSCALPQWGV